MYQLPFFLRSISFNSLLGNQRITYQNCVYLVSFYSRMVINPENPHLDNNTVLSPHLAQLLFLETYFVNPKM